MKSYIGTVGASSLLDAAISVAQKEVGVCEVPPGSNRGPRVEEYLKSVGLGPGYAWCAAFVFWCFGEASLSLNRVNPLVKTAGCLQHWRATRGVKVTVADAVKIPSLILPGAIFIISRGGGLGHTGIVTGIGEGFIRTVEGNSNASRSAEGGGVCALTRKIGEINVGFIIYS